MQYDKYVRKTTADDVYLVDMRLRKADRAEILAGSGYNTTLPALLIGVQSSSVSLTFTTPDGMPCGLFGAVSTGQWGRVWMVATEEVEKWPMTFLRRCRKWIVILNDIYPVLYNVVYTKNTLHMKWLEWSGFHFMRKVEINGHEFQYFLRGVIKGV